MVTVTLNEVVRKTLNKHRLPLHYYIQFLVFAVDLLKELHFTTLPKQTTVELVLDSNFEATLPVDYVEEICAYEAVGDKLVELPHNEHVSTFDYKDWNVLTPYVIGNRVNYGGFSWEAILPSTGVTPVAGADWKQIQKFGQEPSTQVIGGTAMVANEISDVYTASLGGVFGWSSFDNRGYRILRDFNKIRVDNNSGLTKIYLKYITMPTKVSNQTLIHPMLEPLIQAGINWQKAQYWNEGDYQNKRQEYYNKLRITRAAMKPMNLTDIVNMFRKNSNQAIKT
jgi:hypothetical protein